MNEEKVKISRLTLYHLFKVHDAMKLFKEWEQLDDEEKANKFFNVLVEIEKQ